MKWLGAYLIRLVGFCSLTGLPDGNGNMAARLLWIGLDAMCTYHIPTHFFTSILKPVSDRSCFRGNGNCDLYIKCIGAKNNPKQYLAPISNFNQC